MIRTAAERKADALHKLEHDEDVWVATAGPEGRPHLVPFSLYWDGSEVIAATLADSLTVRNVAASGRVRLALDGTRDVVLIDARARVVPLAETPPEVVEAFVRRCRWDPRRSKAEHAFLFMAPRRVQVWRDEPEIRGRTVMERGRWLA